MAYESTIKLGFGNNLVLGNCPDKLSMEKVAEKSMGHVSMGEMSIDRFGLFEANTPNYNTFYPGITVEDFSPKEADFINPIFRALSEVIVHKQNNPVDFSMGNVLKKSANLLLGQTVKTDHDGGIGNSLGAVSEVAWQEAYKMGAILVPAGIQSKLKIDAKSHPRLARAIMMDPPAIHSTSVTVQFLWEKSHNALTEQEFYNQLGTYDKDGKLIRRIANSVKRYHEISLVDHGADPYAMKVDSHGRIINPVFADITYNKATPTEKANAKAYFFDFKIDLISNSVEPTIPNESNNNNNSQTEVMNKAFLIALAAVFGVKLADGENPTDAETTLIQNAATKAAGDLSVANTTIQQNTTEIARLKGIETQFSALGDVAGKATLLDNFMTTYRDEVLRNYSVLHPTPVESVKKLIAEGSYETIKVLNDQYVAQLNEKFPISCKACGSKEVSRASAQADAGDEDGQQALTFEEIKAKRIKANKKASINNLHDVHEVAAK